MKGKRHSPDQIMGKLREAEAMLGTDELHFGQQSYATPINSSRYTS